MTHVALVHSILTTGGRQQNVLRCKILYQSTRCMCSLSSCYYVTENQFIFVDSCAGALIAALIPRFQVTFYLCRSLIKPTERLLW